MSRTLLRRKTTYITGRNIVTMHLDQIAEETSSLIKFLLEVEKERSIRHTHYFKDYRLKFVAFYKGIYNSSSNSNFIERLRSTGYQSSEFREALEIAISNLRKIGSTMCSLLSLRYYGDRRTRMTPSRLWRTDVLTSRVCDHWSGAEGFHRLTSSAIASGPQAVPGQCAQGDR